MNFKLGEYVTRESYNNDLVFQIIDIEDDIAYLRGVDVRLYADSELDDLNKVTIKKETDRTDIEKVESLISLDRNEYFYLPGKIVQFDSDKFYLDRCIKFYKDMHLEAYGIKVKENEIEEVITETLEKYKPDIVVITGHDFLKKHAKDKTKIENYQNSENFVNAIKKARIYEKNQDKLIIISGACQSNYEELIKAGSNFASSPKRINIHTYDPAVIAIKVASTSINKTIDFESCLKLIENGRNAFGGIETKGKMRIFL